MRRLILSLFTASVLFAQKPAPEPKHREPEEEDKETLGTVKEYSFNPVQAQAEVKIGQQYLKNSKYKAAVGRFREALKWNPQSAEAYLALGITLEKSKDMKGAKEAYAKYLELEPSAKNAPEIRKKL